jgi:hypothetical protein
MKCSKFLPIALLLSVLAVSCKKFVTADPPKTQTLSINVFENDQAANSAVAGMYSYLYQLNNTFSSFGGYHLTICTGLSADELARPAQPSDPFYLNNLAPGNNDVKNIWSSAYAIIYNANAIIEGLNKSKAVSEAYKKQLTGEALFVRAFCYFYLISLFGDVPYVTSTDVNNNKSLPRTSSSDIFTKIVSDLKTAQDLLMPDYSFSNNEKVRANRLVVTAFLARVYLYLGDWGNAEAQATTILSQTSLFSLNSDLSTVFYKNSKEAIWQILTFGGDGHTTVGNWIIPANATTIPTFALSPFLFNAFENNDQRKVKWINTYTVNSIAYRVPYKYKNKLATSGNTGEYDMALRLAEQYLIRAEARAQLNNASGALSDLNVIRHRAGLPDTSANDRTSLLAEILHERQVELFVEWGHRWFDLKRTGLINTVLASEKTGWQTKSALFPVPSVEIGNNPNLTQNNGY